MGQLPKTVALGLVTIRGVGHIYQKKSIDDERSDPKVVMSLVPLLFYSRVVFYAEKIQITGVTGNQAMVLRIFLLCLSMCAWMVKKWAVF